MRDNTLTVTFVVDQSMSQEHTTKLLAYWQERHAA